MKTLRLLALAAASRMLLSACSAGPLQLTLPPTWYAVPGVPMSLYFDNIVLTERPEDYRFEVKCDVGTTEQRRWTVTPTGKDVGAHTMEIVVKDARGR